MLFRSWLLFFVVSACATAPPGRAAVTAVRRVPPASPRADGPRGSGFTLEREGLPAAFGYLSPREREQWHACRPFFLRNRSRPAGPPAAVAVPPREVHLEFELHVAEYVDQPDGAARRSLLIAHGCPDTLIDLADGTHLELIEGVKSD